MNRIEGLDRERVLVLIRNALSEDGADEDATCAQLAIEDRPTSARIVAGTRGVLAGGMVVGWVFESVDTGARIELPVPDGSTVVPGQVVVKISGRARHVLAGERVALNFLQRLSGVATLTAAFVERVAGTGVRILDTRKTTPLHRELERYAVRVGGGHNHRFNLTDMILVKENHIRVLGGLQAVVSALQRCRAMVPVEVEVDSMDALEQVLGAPVDRIMLDNFTPAQVSHAVSVLEDYKRNQVEFAPEVEVSGGVSLENVREYAVPGVDFISVGALTHSASSLDFSLEVETP